MLIPWRGVSDVSPAFLVRGAVDGDSFAPPASTAVGGGRAARGRLFTTPKFADAREGSARKNLKRLA